MKDFEYLVYLLGGCLVACICIMIFMFIKFKEVVSQRDEAIKSVREITFKYFNYRQGESLKKDFENLIKTFVEAERQMNQLNEKINSKSK